MVTSRGASGHSAYRRERAAISRPITTRRRDFGTIFRWPIRIPERSALPDLPGSRSWPTSLTNRTTGADAVMYQPLISAICASDKVTTDDGSGWKFTFAAWAKAAAMADADAARARLPARPPKGDCARSASNDTLPSLVLDRSADRTILPAHAH